MPQRHVGQYVVNEVSACVFHSPCRAGWADRSPLAGEWEGVLVLTLLAAEFDESELGPPAGQVRPECLLDEGRDTALRVVGVAEALEKLIDVPFDPSVEEPRASTSVLRPTTWRSPRTEMNNPFGRSRASHRISTDSLIGSKRAASPRWRWSPPGSIGVHYTRYWRNGASRFCW